VFHHQSAVDVSQLPTGSYLVRRNLASMDGYLVFDDTDTQVYRFKNHLSFPNQRWTMVDAGGADVATLVRPAMHIHPTFTVSRSGHPDVTIRKAGFAPIDETWRIEGDDSGDIDIHGDVLNHEFTFTKGGETVGTTTRRWVSIADSYALQANGMDPILAIAAAVGIDSVEHEADRR
jgi:uncharacterized protein YxjI